MKRPLRILAIDTSSPRGGAALAAEDRPAVLLAGGEGETYSSRLFRWLQELALRLEGGLVALDGVAVAVGPGSFTGLRIGVAAAKGISLVAACPLIPFSTLEAAALAAGEGPALRRPILAAGRGEVYTAAYRLRRGGLEAAAEEQVVAPAAIELDADDEPIFLFGSGLPLCSQRLRGLAPPGSVFGDAQPALAEAMAEEGMRRLRRGEGVEPAELRMNYIRLSDAERKSRERR